MLKLGGLTAGYGVVPVIHDIELEVKQGETVALLGPNGAGKTALLKTIMGVLKPVSGTINFNGSEITRMPSRSIVSRGVVMVPCSDRVFPEMTVDENLRVGNCSARARAKRRELFAHVYEMFPKLEERRGQMGATLSGGEQGMLALGRGLMGDPTLLLVDELSLGLAPIMITHCFEAIKELKRRGFSLLLAEQNAMLALQVSDRAYLLRHGRVVLSGAPEQLMQDEITRKTYLGI